MITIRNKLGQFVKNHPPVNQYNVRVNRFCKVCGKEIRVHLYSIRNGHGNCCSNNCAAILRGRKYRGKNHPYWKGGKNKHHNRWYIFKPEHPFVNSNGYIRRSRFIAEKYLGRFLKKSEVVHHINSKTDDDRPKNLYLFSSQSNHRKYEVLKNRSILQSNLT